MTRRQRRRKLERARAHGLSVRAAKAERAAKLFDSMTKPELIDYADRNGIVVAKSWNKGMILGRIKDAFTRS
jgi:hypothetical protein